MNNGYIKLHRCLLDDEIFASQVALKIWVWLLLKANYQQKHIAVKVGRGDHIVTLKSGELLFGRISAEDQLNIDGSTIYKWIKKFESMSMIKINSNSHYSIITICKYEYYQNNIDDEVTANELPSNNQVATIDQPSSNHVTQIRKYKKEKNIKEYKEENVFLKNPFSDNFLNEWIKWLDYKKNQHKFVFKSISSEQISIDQLFKMAKGNENIAIEMINKSIANGWKGLIELKPEQKQKGNNFDEALYKFIND